MDYELTVGHFSRALDYAGVAVIVAGAILSALFALRSLSMGTAVLQAYRTLRQSLGRSIILGLELLVAADIIRTVAVTPTFDNVGVLALIVLVRTFLSFSLEVELSGQWPWKRYSSVPPDADPNSPPPE